MIKQEGYHDCEAALALKYPQDKMLKLLHRKKNLAVACKNPNYIDESVSQLVDCMKANDAATSEIEKGLLSWCYGNWPQYISFNFF